MDNSGDLEMSENERPDHRLISAYNRMMDRIRSAGEEADREMRPKLAYLVERAKDRAVELGELTREEAERIGDYLRRDIEDAAGYLAGEKSNEIIDWLKLDLEIVEKRLLDLFTGVADQTRFELLELERQARAASEYHTGQITGLGTLQCPECGRTMRFHETARIPPCPGCRGTRFLRAERPEDSQPGEPRGT